MEIAIDMQVVCSVECAKCGSSLTAEHKNVRGSGIIEVEPCERCIEESKDE